MDLLLTAGLPWPTILWTIFLDEVMIITGLIGALTASRFKWGMLRRSHPGDVTPLTIHPAFWTFGTAAMFFIFWNLAVEGRKHARHLGSDVYRCYNICGVLTLFVWLLYPIAWGCAEGGNAITGDSEVSSNREGRQMTR